MIRSVVRLCLSLCLGFSLAVSAARADVTVFAAVSLKDGLDEAAAAWRTDTGAEIRLSFAGTSALARQIIQGAPADIFIAASPDWMDAVEAADLLVADSRHDLLGNRLVLIGGAEAAPLALGADTNLAEMLNGGKLAMALVDAVPAGIYGKAALTSFGLWADVSNQVAQADNVRAALALVAWGEAPLGIVYETDAMAEQRVAVVATFPGASHPPIVYPAALVKGAGPDAAAFLAFLSSARGAAFFTARGFSAPE